MPPKTKLSFFSPFYLFTLSLSFLLLSSCGGDKRAVEALSPEVRALVYGFTSGTISKASPIRVQFTRSVAEETEIGEAVPASLIRFEPAVEGTAVWEDERTLRFDPAEPLNSATEYLATVQLKKIIPEAPAEAKSFAFSFQTRGQFLELQVEGLYALSPSELSKQQLKGRLFTADFADNEAVEKILKAQQAGKTLDINWSHSADQQQHIFTVLGVNRGQKASEVELSWNGNPIGVEVRDERSFEVPALGDFKVSDVRVEYQQSPYLIAHFSDPLQKNQVLEGLVRIDGYEGQLNFLVDGQDLRIYPSQRLSGPVRLAFSPGILNSQGKRMPNPGVWELTVQDAKPQIRLVGNGVIMPEGQGLLFPFEAIGLQAVDVEIFKIFNNNILQFLQNNRLDGSYDLRTVGRIVLQKRVDLRQLNPNARSSDWTRYALDLSKMLQQDPEAIYQIRLGFRPDYASFPCPGQQQGNKRSAGLDQAFTQEEDEEPESIMDNWYGFGGYYEGYDWAQREDPCYSAYYNSDRFVARNVLSSNLGIIAKGGNGQYFFVAVTDLRTAQAVSGATIEFYDFQQQLLSTVQTDGKGLAEVKLPRKPFIILARQGAQKGYLRLDDGDALSMSAFDVAGSETQKGLKGVLFAERGVWRPGDSVFLHFILDDRYNRLPDNYPITFELIDPRGAIQERRTSSENEHSIYPLHFSTSPEAPTGNWIAKVKAGGAQFERIIKIETVKPNRLSIDLKLGGDKLLAAMEPFTSQLEVKWLHGAPAQGLEAKVEVDLAAAGTRFPKWNNYVFDDPARQIDFSKRTLFEGRLNQEGETSFQTELLGNEMAPGMLRADFRTRVLESGGDISTGFKSLPYHPYSSYAGLSLPENEYGEPATGVGKNTLINFASVSTEGAPQANRRLSVGVYRVDWRWWWDQGYDDLTNFNSSNHYNAVSAPKELSTNGQGKVSWTTRFDQWGRYLVRVCDLESGHCSGDFIYVGSPDYGSDDAGRQAAAMLNFSTDKERYQVGDQVNLSIPISQSGRVLISLENGSKVLKSYWLEAKSGDKTSFSFEATADMAPTIYAHVTLVQPHGQVENDLPIRLYGVLPILVEDPATRLEPVADLPKELAPEQGFTVEVSEKKGKPMAYTLAIVEEGLLNLTNFKTPNPHEVIYAREALGVRTWDIFDQVLGAYGGKLDRILSVGGDAALNPAALDERANRFEPVVMHLGPFYLKKGQRVRHQLRMPNYVGAVRVMVVAAGEGAYGAFDRQIPVKQPLMVLPTLPRVLSPGEQVRLPVTVFAMDRKVGEVSLKVEEKSGLVRWSGSSGKQIRFSRPGEEMVYFDFKVGDKTGVARFTVNASGGGVKASQTIEVDVRNPNPVQTATQAAVLAGQSDWNGNFEVFGMPGTNEAYLEVSSLPPLNLGERLNYLLSYPYGCVEQTLSAGFPQLFVHRLMDLKQAEKERAAENVAATIDRLRQFQTDQGGFAYWPGENTADQWSTNYGGHFLLEAQIQGYTLPAGLLQRWIDFQKKAARMWSPNLSEYGYGDARSNQLNQAYRLYTLALAKSADLAAMNRLREVEKLDRSARWRLAAAYSVAGKTDVARNLVQNVPTEIENYRDLGETFGSTLRDRAMIMETLLLMGDEKRAAQLLQYVSDQLGSEAWHSTQTTAFALLAVSKYVGDVKPSGKFQFSYQLNNGKTVEAGSGNPVMQIELPARAGSKNALRVRNSGPSKLFVRLVVRGQPLPGEEKAASSDLQIAVRYLDADGKVINPSSLTQGTDFVAEVRVIHPGDRPIPYQEMALSQIFPSGWEILNTRLDNQSITDIAGGSDHYEYQDIRDDRVNTFFDLGVDEVKTFYVQLNAAYTGRFYLPATSCEAMYDQSIYAREKGQWVEVRARENGRGI